ncbi:hypothetical protein K3723_06610 [Leisingera caerulea]|uniref:primase-helicase zinc-binding domain-containing protein n=1 Tax=Leisingera caerulea TaxID=506591 RepID=UPI002200A787|nr:hypothetical protein K3723_06610 [Leisingera caerulea]
MCNRIAATPARRLGPAPAACVRAIGFAPRPAPVCGGQGRFRLPRTPQRGATKCSYCELLPRSK